MLKLKLQYFDLLMWTVDSLGMTQMLWNVEDRRRRERQRTRWLDGITNLMGMSLSGLHEVVDRKARRAAAYRVANNWIQLSNWATTYQVLRTILSLSFQLGTFLPTFYFFFLSDCIARTANTVLNRSVESGHHCLFLNLEGRLSPWSIMLALGLL